MKYDFTSIMDRHGMDAVSVDGLGAIPGMTPDPPKDGFDAIPLWIAGMNFPTAPAVQEAIMARVKHPAFGYFFPSPQYFSAIINWQERRNGVKSLVPDNIGYENGVIGGIVSALNVFCCKGDKVLLHSPTYTGFTWGLEANGYGIVHSPLVQDKDGVWTLPIWSERLHRIRSMPPYSVLRSIPAAACGLGRSWNRSWRCSKNTMSW